MKKNIQRTLNEHCDGCFGDCAQSSPQINFTDVGSSPYKQNNHQHVESEWEMVCFLMLLFSQVKRFCPKRLFASVVKVAMPRLSR